jgi:hypothetical protein
VTSSLLSGTVHQCRGKVEIVATCGILEGKVFTGVRGNLRGSVLLLGSSRDAVRWQCVRVVHQAALVEMEEDLHSLG